MTVAELIEELKKFPLDAEVWLVEGDFDDEIEPAPQIWADGTVRL